ncbi:MAG TPA: hypothetical protein VLT16_05550, partial [Candidatus Limnocylindrales bacterium]|nr:hypothetical protein [Candidatus Limnocylindrales bacterium]
STLPESPKIAPRRKSTESPTKVFDRANLAGPEKQTRLTVSVSHRQGFPLRRHAHIKRRTISNVFVSTLPGTHRAAKMFCFLP